MRRDIRGEERREEEKGRGRRKVKAGEEIRGVEWRKYKRSGEEKEERRRR